MVLTQLHAERWCQDDVKLFLWSLGYGDLDFDKAVHLYQKFNSEDYALAGLAVYDRLPDLDGVVGKATLLAFKNRQCLFPDHYVQPNQDYYDRLSHEQRAVLKSVFDAGEALTRPGVRRIRRSPPYSEESTTGSGSYSEESTTGSGSWRSGCYDEINPVRHVVKVHFDTSNWRSNWKTNEKKIIDACIKAAARRGVYLVQVDSKREANLHVSHRNGSGWIGLAQLPGSNPSCALQLFCYVDTRYWQGIDSACQLLMHELGHNLNLPHVSQSSRNVMSPRITWRTEGFVGFADNDASTSRLQRYFGTEPYPLDDDDDDDDDDNDDGEVVGRLVLDEDLKAGTYDLKKKGGIIQI